MARSYQRPRERLHIVEWPAIFAEAWRRSLETGGVFDEIGGAARWSNATRQSVERGFGLYLGFLARTNRLRPDVELADLCNPDWLRSYYNCYTDRGLRPATIATRFNLLNEALRVMAPRLNRTLLVLGLRRLQSKGRRETKKWIPPVSASDLYTAGIARMNRVPTQTYEKRDVQAVQFGDGLMMAMLAAKPIRIGSLARTNVGEHLLRKVDRYHWTFSAAETKNAEPVHVELPGALTTYVDQWLEIYRPVLLGPTMSRAMWISCCRERMAVQTIYARFCAATLEELGHRINPHMVRSIVATSVSVSMPNEVRIIPSLLDHRSSTVARRHYIVADSLAASEQYLERLNGRRQAALGSLSRKQRKPG